jgi:stage IV sporulation protein FB
MNFLTDSPLFFGFPIATLWGARVRVSPFYALLLLWLIGQFGAGVGALAFVVLTVSTLLHEYGHVFAARLTGGDADDVILWPLGGLALCRRAPTFQSEFLTATAGPLVNLALSILTFSWVYSTEDLWTALNPLDFPELHLEQQGVLHVLLMLTFAINWKLMLLNLVPMLPLDGSNMLLAVARRRWEPIVSRTAMLIASTISHIIIAAVALNIDSSRGVRLLFLSYMLLPVTIVEWIRLQAANLIGYEIEDTEHFEPYGEDEEGSSQRPPAPGLLERWKQERERKRAEKEEQERVQAEAQLDALLEKVHQQGIDSLTESEKRFLKQASARYRGQSRPS